jgi:L-asparaginase
VRPRLAVFSGPTATALNTPPLVTGQRVAGGRARGELLRPQRLAAPATVLIEAFSAHPLERDAADLYARPDGYLDTTGALHEAPSGDADVPVYRVELRPEDGLYLLPYVARRADGTPWEHDGEHASAPEPRSRQPFFPDAARLFEEIDRFGLGSDGRNQLLASRADFDFVRAGPPGGYRKGLPETQRTDVGEGDIPPEVAGEDYFPYRPRHLRREPSQGVLASITNTVQRTLASGGHQGALWLEGSPFLEETLYWLHLVLDTDVPLVGVPSPDWPHGVLGNVGDRNVVDAVCWAVSGAWRDGDGRDRIGGVLVHGGRLLAAREAQKADARGPGYGVTGGIGGVLGSISQAGQVSLSFLPTRAHTSGSEVCLRRWPRH